MLQNLTDKQLIEYHTLYQNGMKESVRFYDRKKNGFDTKFFYHILRLLDEAEQILLTGNLDLQRAKEEMKAIRNGEWSLEKLEKEVEARELSVEKAFNDSKIPYEPDKDKCRELLIQCIEAHYGVLSPNELVQNNLPINVLRTIQHELDKVRTLI